ncbi:hypothetical protein ACIP1T_02870 [Pseudomonas japonica]|uniref:hypothetical protein n=1 Tax=Pseudomonas japonica TaxID=256466 RepID=UPI0037F3A65C
MTHALLALNALALATVIGMSMLPKATPVHSLDYRTSMPAHPAVLGQTPEQHQQQVPRRERDHFSL